MKEVGLLLRVNPKQFYKNKIGTVTDAAFGRPLKIVCTKCFLLNLVMPVENVLLGPGSICHIESCCYAEMRVTSSIQTLYFCTSLVAHR